MEYNQSSRQIVSKVSQADIDRCLVSTRKSTRQKIQEKKNLKEEARARKVARSTQPQIGSSKADIRLQREQEKAVRALEKLGTIKMEKTKATDRIVRNLAISSDISAREILSEEVESKKNTKRLESFPIVMTDGRLMEYHGDTIEVSTWAQKAAELGVDSTLPNSFPDIEENCEEEDLGVDFQEDGEEYDEDGSIKKKPLSREQRILLSARLNALHEEKREAGKLRSYEKLLRKRLIKNSKREQGKRSAFDDSRALQTMVEARLASQLLESSGSTKKTDRVLLTGCAEILLDRNHKGLWTTAHIKEIRKLVDEARIWRQNMNWHGYSPASRMEFGSYLSSRVSLPTTVGVVLDRETLSFVISCVPDKRKHARLNELYNLWDSRTRAGITDVEALRVQFFDLTKGARLPIRTFQGSGSSKMSSDGISFNVTSAKIPVTVAPRDIFEVCFPDYAELVKRLGGLGIVGTRIINLLCVFTSLWECSSYKNIIAQLTLLINNNLDSSLGAYLVRLWDLLAQVKDHISVRFQAKEDDEEENSINRKALFTEKFGPLLRSNPLMAAFWEFVTSFSIVSVLGSTGILGDEETISRWQKKIVSSLVDRTTVDTLFLRFIRFTEMLFTNLHTAVMKGDWKLLFGGFSVSDWVETSYCILDDETTRLDNARPGISILFDKAKRDGKISPRILKPMTVEERVEFMTSLVSEGLIHQKRLEEKLGMSQAVTIARLLERLRNEIHSLGNQKVSGQNRVQPFSVRFWGAPGCGKSRSAPALAEGLGNSRQLPTGADSIYNVNCGFNFFDGFNNQWCVIFDDVDQDPAPPTAGTLTHVRMVLDLINVKSTQLEQADVTAKGKKYANFLASLYFSNYQYGRLQGYSLAPLTFWRRFNYDVHMVVKPQFATAGGALKKKEFLDGSEDYWDFYVGFYDDSKFNPTIPFTSYPFDDATRVKFTSRFALMAFLNVRFNKHIDGELIQQAKNEALCTTFCPHCCLAIHRHPSGVPCKGSFNFQASDIGEDVSLIYGVLGVLVGYWFFGLEVVIGGLVFFLSVRLFGWEAFVQKLILRELKYRYFQYFAISHPSRFFHLWFDRYFELSPWEFRVRSRGLEERHFLSWRERLYNNKEWLIALGGVIMVFKIYSRFMTSDEFSRRYQAYVSENDVSRPAFSFANKEAVFHRIPVERKKIFPFENTTSLADMVLFARKRLLTVVEYRESTYVTKGKELLAWHYTGNFFGIPRHYFFKHKQPDTFDARASLPKGEFFMELSWVGEGKTAQRFCLEFGPAGNALAVPGRDLVIFYCPALFPVGDGIRRFVPTSTVSSVVSSFDKFNVALARDFTFKEGTLNFSNRFFSHVYSRALISNFVDGELVDGDCGGLVVAQGGQYLGIVGSHSLEDSYADGRHMYMAEELIRSDIDPTMELLKNIHGGTFGAFQIESSQVNFQARDVTLVDLPVKSSLNVALSNCESPPLRVLGSVFPPVPVGNPRSHVFRTPFAHYLNKMEEELGGSPLYDVPVFSGKMVDVDGEKRWRDPFTVNLSLMKNCCGKSSIWDWAVNDYLTGMEELPGADLIRPLTFYEAIVGIDGTGITHLNLKTSTGAPFFVKKSQFFEVDRIRGVVVFNIAIQYYLDRILSIVDSGDVFSALCAHTLKDEAISQKKIANCKVRVFNTAPVAYNILLKMYLGPLAIWMRQHRAFFESCVGMNICGRDLDSMINELEKYGDNGYRDSDYEGFDIKQSSSSKMAELRVWVAAAQFCGYTELEVLRVIGLFLGAVFTTRFIKNDLFLLCFGQASGLWLTADGNSVNNSLSFRYSFRNAMLLLKIDEDIVFRSVVGLRTLGDDNVSNTSQSVRWFTTEILKEGMREIGHSIVDAAKTGEMTGFGRITDVSFLKRHFERVIIRFLSFEYVGWKAPIERKSIVKMLTTAVKSELSLADHMCCLLSNALAEAYLHGEQYYMEILGVVVKIVKEFGYGENQYLRLLTYNQFDQRYIDGVFTVYE